MLLEQAQTRTNDFGLIVEPTAGNKTIDQPFEMGGYYSAHCNLQYIPIVINCCQRAFGLSSMRCSLSIRRCSSVMTQNALADLASWPELRSHPKPHQDTAARVTSSSPLPFWRSSQSFAPNAAAPGALPPPSSRFGWRVPLCLPSPRIISAAGLRALSVLTGHNQKSSISS